MDSKIVRNLLIANTVGLVIVLGLLFQPQVFSLGAASHFSGPVDSANGFTESGTTIIDGGGGLTIASGTVLTGNLSATGIRNSSGTTVGGATVITKMACGTLSTTTAALIAGATTTLVNAISVSGATSSQNQAYYAGYASTTAGLIVSASPNGTSGKLDLTLFNAGTGTWTGSTTTYSVCLTQF